VPDNSGIVDRLDFVWNIVFGKDWVMFVTGDNGFGHITSLR